MSQCNHAATIAQVALRVIDDGELAGRDALHVLLALDDPAATVNVGELATHDVGRVAVLEHDVHGALDALPRVARDEVHLVKVERTPVLLVGAVAVADVDDIFIDVFAHDIPWSTAQAQAFALPDGVEPVAAVLAQLAARLQFDDGTGLLAQVAADKVVIINLAQEADALAVTTIGVGQLGFLGDAAHLLLGQIANGEDDMLQLVVGDLCQEVGLVLDGIHRRGEVFHAVNDIGGRIMPRSSQVKILAPPLLKEAELDHPVAHHVGVGRQAGTHGAQGIFHHVVPVFLMQRHHLERQAVAMRDEGTHLDVLLGTAVALVIVHADADVEQVQVLALLLEPVDHHGAVNASRYQYSNTQYLIL